MTNTQSKTLAAHDKRLALKYNTTPAIIRRALDAFYNANQDDSLALSVAFPNGLTQRDAILFFIARKTISTVAGVCAFARQLYAENGTFHCDDNFGEYVNHEGGAAYHPHKAALRNELMEQCFAVCERVGLDVYEVMGREKDNQRPKLLEYDGGDEWTYTNEGFGLRFVFDCGDEEAQAVFVFDETTDAPDPIACEQVDDLAGADEFVEEFIAGFKR